MRMHGGGIPATAKRNIRSKTFLWRTYPTQLAQLLWRSDVRLCVAAELQTTCYKQ